MRKIDRNPFPFAIWPSASQKLRKAPEEGASRPEGYSEQEWEAYQRHASENAFNNIMESFRNSPIPTPIPKQYYTVAQPDLATTDAALPGENTTRANTPEEINIDEKYYRELLRKDLIKNAPDITSEELEYYLNLNMEFLKERMPGILQEIRDKQGLEHAEGVIENSRLNKEGAESSFLRRIQDELYGRYVYGLEEDGDEVKYAHRKYQYEPPQYWGEEGLGYESGKQTLKPEWQHIDDEISHEEKIRRMIMFKDPSLFKLHLFSPRPTEDSEMTEQARLDAPDPMFATNYTRNEPRYEFPQYRQFFESDANKEHDWEGARKLWEERTYGRGVAIPPQRNLVSPTPTPSPTPSPTVSNMDARSPTPTPGGLPTPSPTPTPGGFSTPEPTPKPGGFSTPEPTPKPGGFTPKVPNFNWFNLANNLGAGSAKMKPP